MKEYIESNRKLWNEWTKVHVSGGYDVEGFRSGRNSLHSVELDEVGDVSGKSLLHLQCHFGMDTLSWARLGAKVTGVDISDESISYAQSLAADLKIDARFIRSDIYELPSALDEEFDIVYTSYGILAWLPGIKEWGKVVARHVKPGGVFHIVEFHPFADVFDDADEQTELKVGYSYFHNPAPTIFQPDGTYADRSAKTTVPSHEWWHSMSDITNALIGAGLQIESMQEYQFSVDKRFAFMEKRNGYWRLTNGDGMIPLMFSLKCRKPE